MARQRSAFETAAEQPWHDRRVASEAPGEYRVLGNHEPSVEVREDGPGWSADQLGAALLVVFGVAVFAFLLGMVLAG